MVLTPWSFLALAYLLAYLFNELYVLAYLSSFPLNKTQRVSRRSSTWPAMRRPILSGNQKRPIAAHFYRLFLTDMLRSHLMGAKLMRRLPWPLALPFRWFATDDPDRPSATRRTQPYCLWLARKHWCSRPILPPWHDRYHDGKSDTGPTILGTTAFLSLNLFSMFRAPRLIATRRPFLSCHLLACWPI